jgi:hypothetical protein
MDRIKQDARQLSACLLGTMTINLTYPRIMSSLLKKLTPKGSHKAGRTPAIRLPIGHAWVGQRMGGASASWVILLHISDVLYQNNPDGCFVAGPFIAGRLISRTFRRRTFRRRTFRRRTFRRRTFRRRTFCRRTFCRCSLFHT